jgi:Skp family chaperone for outer membrane proteins
MKALIAMATVAVLLASITLAGDAFAQKSGKQEVQDIMTADKKAIHKAQADFTAAVKKANEDARAAIAKGIPTDQINAESKAAIAKARADLKAAKDAAQKETKASLSKLKAAIKP